MIQVWLAGMYMYIMDYSKGPGGWEDRLSTEHERRIDIDYTVYLRLL